MVVGGVNMGIKEEIYQWIQILGVAKNIHIGRLNFNSEFIDKKAPIPIPAKLRLMNVIDDMYSDKIDFYIIYKICRCINRANKLCIESANEDERKEYRELIEQTCDMLAMMGGSIVSNNGVYLHTIGCNHEVENIIAFDITKLENVKPFEDLIFKLLTDNIEYSRFNKATAVFKCISVLNTMFMDALVTIINIDRIVALKKADMEQASEFIGIFCESLEHNISGLSKLLEDTEFEDIELQEFKNDIYSLSRLMLDEVVKIKASMFEYKTTEVFKSYIRNILKYISTESIVKDMSEIIVAVIDKVNGENKEE